MVVRLAVFLVFQGMGAALGWWIDHTKGALIGLVMANLGWFAFDLMRGLKVARWLRSSDHSSAPLVGGLWGEVTERIRRVLKARDQAGHDAEARLRDFLAAIQASPNGVILLDPTGRIEWFNQTAGQQFGLDPAKDNLQLIGNLVRDPAFSAYYASGDYGHDVTVIGRGSTVGRPVRISVHLHAYGEGRKLLLSRDVTSLEQAEAMRRDFVANVSHEIRTPLTVLAGFVETLQTLHLSEEDQKRYLEMMATQAHRMQALVQDLLMLSKLEGSPPPGATDWIPVDRLMLQCEQEAQSLSRLLVVESVKPHRLKFAFTELFEIAGSQSEIYSAMANLVNNAVRYTPGGAAINVSWTRNEDGHAEFAVQDSGPGIAPEHIPRLTERFYRVDRSRSRETGGTGLGLAIVKHVLQRHGGELRIDSQPGVGSTFTMLLPSSRIRIVNAEVHADGLHAPASLLA